MKKKSSKSEIKKQIQEFFLDIKNKSSNDVKKIKRIAMSQNIPLKETRKKFCKKCFVPYKNPKIRIKNKIKIITCENCDYVSRWKIKSNSS
jgi:RNase P subunit RPR2|tara:strand:+ start:124 stop:396 length:273 start_codon:yes stop_codon:yes gene_type:complete